MAVVKIPFNLLVDGDGNPLYVKNSEEHGFQIIDEDGSLYLETHIENYNLAINWLNESTKLFFLHVVNGTLSVFECYLRAVLPHLTVSESKLEIRLDFIHLRSGVILNPSTRVQSG